MITPEQEAKYVENQGLYCPYCGSPRVVLKRNDVDEPWTQCLDCKGQWRDVWELVGCVER